MITTLCGIYTSDPDKYVDIEIQPLDDFGFDFGSGVGVSISIKSLHQTQACEQKTLKLSASEVKFLRKALKSALKESQG